MEPRFIQRKCRRLTIQLSQSAAPSQHCLKLFQQTVIMTIVQNLYYYQLLLVAPYACISVIAVKISLYPSSRIKVTPCQISMKSVQRLRTASWYITSRYYQQELYNNKKRCKRPKFFVFANRRSWPSMLVYYKSLNGDNIVCTSAYNSE